MTGVAGATYAPLGSRSAAAIVALYVKVGACVLAIGADVGRIVVAGRLEDGRALPDDLSAADQLVAFGALVELVAFLVAAALFLRWQVRAHRNLVSLGAGTQRVGAGVGAWFVPGLNLVAPRRLMISLWRAGEPGRGAPRLFGVWWAVWLVAVIAVLAAWTLLGDAADVAERQRIDTLRALATALSAVAAGLAIAVVARTSARQERRAAETGAPRAAVSTADTDQTPGGLAVVSEEHERATRTRPPGA
ncbi:MAG: DUF4328 domain-containing protein [Solirubrobacterales bacterium]|nr:DUF4328 domain-containing protein [Solirubrobacterales bacterium]